MKAAAAQRAYLKAEFARYWPEYISEIEVDNTSEEEVIQVTIRENGETMFLFRMEIGTDDPWYQFQTAEGIILTIPPEVGEDECDLPIVPDKGQDLTRGQPIVPPETTWDDIERAFPGAMEQSAADHLNEKYGDKTYDD